MFYVIHTTFKCVVKCFHLELAAQNFVILLKGGFNEQNLNILYVS